MSRKETKALAEESLNRLFDLVAAGLKSVIIYSNIMAFSPSFRIFDEIERDLDVALKGKILDHVGENGLKHICVCELVSFLKTKFQYSESEPERALSEILTGEEIDSIAEKVVWITKRLPIKYGLCFELPKIIYSSRPQDVDELAIAPNLKIIYNASKYFERFTFKDLFDFRGNYFRRGLSRNTNAWIDETAYLMISAEGYCGEFGGDVAIDIFTNAAKSFIGQYFAKRGIIQSYGAVPSNDKINVACFELGKTNVQVHSFEIHSDLKKSLNSFIWQVWDDLNRTASTSGYSSFQNTLSQIRQASENSEANPNLNLASQWYFDSIISSNNMMSFVQSSTVVEVLFGDKIESDAIGVTNLLANRYAYLTGTSHRDREQKIKEFKHLYGIRCKIVHGGKNRLSIDESKDLERLKKICATVISKEIDNAKNTNK